MHRIPLCSLAAFAALCLFGSLSPAHATIDMALNTSNFVAGTDPSTLSIDGVIDASSEPSIIYGACLTIRFDPTKVSISNLHTDSSTGWVLSAYNTDHTADGWVKAVMFNNSTYGQTETGTALLFTVTPSSSTVDVNDCDTLRLSGSESDICDDQFYDYLTSDPCDGIMIPPGQDTSDWPVVVLPGDQFTNGPFSGPNSPSGSQDCDPYLWNGERILRIAAGLMAPLPSDNPNFGTPRTEQDVATLDVDGDGRITVVDAIVFFKMWNTAPATAWTAQFIGNTLVLPCGNAANATAMPAISRLNPTDLNSPWIAAFAMGHINGKNYMDPRTLDIGGVKSSNTNNVYILEDSGGGVFGIRPNWPQPLRDCPIGITLANFASSSNVNVIANNYQDSFTQHWGYISTRIVSRPYVWNSDASAVGLFANSYNPDSPNPNAPNDLTQAIGVISGHCNTAPPVWDLGGTFGSTGPLMLCPAEGDIDQNTGTIYYGGISAFNAAGTKVFQSQSTNKTGAWYMGPSDIDLNTDIVDPNDSLLEAPIVLAKRYQRPDRAVITASDTGFVYAWDNSGTPLPGFAQYINSPHPAGTQTDTVPGRGRAPVTSPIVAGDLFSNGHFEVVVPTGSFFNYSFYGYNDGAIYCWGDTGGQYLWRYPTLHDPQLAADWVPGFGSGASVGRVRRDSSAPSVVAADAEGKVIALDPSNGQVVWSYQIEKYPGQTYPNNLCKHPYYRSVVTQPLIADINSDGVQEVIVGTIDGKIYAIQQKPAPNLSQGQVVSGFPLKTMEGPQSIWNQGGQKYVETHGEEIYGIGLVPLNTGDPNRAYLLATTLWPAVSANSAGGHAYLFDLGSNSWNGMLADWPQSQQNAIRTGYYPGP